MADLIGLVASLMSFVMNVPSVMAVWRNRNDSHALRGSSLAVNLMIMANASLWGVYAWLTQAFWVGAPGLVNFPLAATNAFLIARARKAEAGEKVTALG